MKNLDKVKLISMLFIVLGTFSNTASAVGVLTITPSVTNVAVGDSFSVVITGSGFVGTSGGFSTLDFGNGVGADIINIQTGIGSFIDPIWNFTTPSVLPDAVNNTTALVDNVQTAGLFLLGTPTDFTVMTLEFFASSVGTVNFDLSGLSWTGADLVPDVTLASVTVSAVPVPPALLLFMSGIVGLLGVSRRRNVTI